MSVLTAQRCLQHPEREAIARCPECGHFQCRECITDFGGRVICSACLARLAALPVARERGWGNSVGQVCLGGLGVLVAWFSFYTLGRMLMDRPSEFHAKALWQMIDPEE